MEFKFVCFKVFDLLPLLFYFPICFSDDTLTNINLFSSLDGVTDWYSLGVWLRVPDSKQNEIKTTHKTEVQRLESLVMYYLNHHPAPSWREVAHALYRMDGGQEKNHKLLRKIYKNRFITGNTI